MASLSDPLVQELLNGRYIASLATHNADGSIHQVAVWYLFHEEHLYVATAPHTTKARNVAERGKASLMVDSRDVLASRGVTAMGRAELQRGDEALKWNRLVHQKYMSAQAIADPRVGPVFAAEDGCIRITPEKFIAWDVRDFDNAAMGGALCGTPGYLRPVDV
jgi:PPOX class probable F420-dependent enzyme